MPLDTSQAPATASPLWVIALFIALSEATAGIAAITTDGAARLIFACFAVAFPTVVFAVFVWLLVKHAPNLYAPRQYSSEITPEIYRVGISRSNSELLARAVGATLAPLLEGVSDGKASDDVREQVARRFEVAIEQSSVAVTLTPPLSLRHEELQIPVTSHTTVRWLLDSIYYALRPALKPYSYGRSWLLVDDNGVEYADMGTRWMEPDERLITELGIHPGTHLTVVTKRSIKGSASRRSSVSSAGGMTQR